MTVRSPNESVSEDGVLRTSNSKFLRCLRDQGLEPNPGPLLEGLLKSSGFEHVRVTKMPFPLGSWPLDPRLVSPAPLAHLMLCQIVANSPDC